MVNYYDQVQTRISSDYSGKTSTPAYAMKPATNNLLFCFVLELAPGKSEINGSKSRRGCCVA